jgi:hypothetical protein
MRRGKGRSNRLAAPLTSGVILTFLTLQGAATFRIVCPPEAQFPSLSSFRILCAPALYPFLDYPLYAPPHYEGETIGWTLVFAQTEEMTERPVTARDLGVSAYRFEKAFLRAIEGDHAAVHEYINLYQRKYGGNLVGFRVVRQPLILSREGIKRGPRDVLGSFRTEAPEKPDGRTDFTME